MYNLNVVDADALYQPPMFNSVEHFVNFYRFHSLKENHETIDTRLIRPVNM